MKKLNILLIEDNPIHARLIGGLLGQMPQKDYALTQVGSLSEAMTALNQQPFDIVLLDLILPDSQEMASFERVSQAAPQLPIVILTSLDDVDLAGRAVAAGARAYLIKTSTNSAGLADAIRRALAPSEDTP